MATFLLKLNCELDFHGAEPRPKEASDWEGQAVTALPPRSLGGGQGAEVTTGDTLIIWTHEAAEWGKGLGLTATAKAGHVVHDEEDSTLEMLDVKLLRPHVRLDRQAGGPTGSQLLDYLRSHRHSRTIEVNDFQASEFWAALSELELKRQELIASYSLTVKTNEQKALEADHREIAEGFERRFASIETRPGQAAFKECMMHLYGGRCAISRVSVSAVLQAAHIVPFSKAIEYRNDPTNGLLLRSDLHVLFDRALITIHPKTDEVVVADALIGSLYEKLSGLVVKHHAKHEFLARHYEEFLARRDKLAIR